MKGLLILLLGMMGVVAIGQNDSSKIEIAIQSEILSDSRSVLISLPNHYSPQKQYPVAYVLDGESLFEGHCDVVNFLSGKSLIPEMIVVGIVNKNRSLDLTHVPDSSSNFQPNGGGKEFESFLVKELIPFVDSNYSTAPYRMLVGHSISGLFASKLLINGDENFNAYIIMDPALWWANNEALAKVNAGLLNSKNSNKSVFLSVANSLPENVESIDQALEDTTNGTLGFRASYQFKQLIDKMNTTNASWKSDYYENESHGTITFISSYDGLKHIFDFYQRPSMQTITDDTYLILDNHYKMLSKKMGYTILPPAYDLSGMAWRCQELDKNNERAFKFLELFLKYYPLDPLAHMQMGQHYELTGDKEKANLYYQKGMELGYEP